MALPAAVRAERQQELVELLEERDRLVARLHEETKEAKQEIRTLDERVRTIRDVLAGRIGEQQEIPGAGGVAMKPSGKAKGPLARKAAR